MIELELNKKNLIEVDFSKETFEKAKYRVQQLKFFHTWVFYYFYCADHKFLKHLFKNAFTFSDTLFKKTLEQIRSKKEFRERLKQIYSPQSNI